MKKYRTDFSKEELHAALHANDDKASEIIGDVNKWNNFKNKFLEFVSKAKKIPVLGGMIDDIMCMVDLVDSYIQKEYRDIPVATIISIVAALVYLLSPIDIIPDAIPFVGYIDDAAVVLLVLNLGVDKDLDKYRAWKDKKRSHALTKFEYLFASEISEVVGDGKLEAILLDNEKIKLLISYSDYKEYPVECKIELINVPKNALQEFDVTDAASMLEVLNEVAVIDLIRWGQKAEKKAFYEPDFDMRWDDFIILEG